MVRTRHGNAWDVATGYSAEIARAHRPPAIGLVSGQSNSPWLKARF